VHKGTIYEGEHDAIVSDELFDAVQARLAERTNPRSPKCSRKPVTLMTGMIFDEHGRPMSPLHTRNHGRRYNYYASNLASDPDQPAQRLPAGELEAAVRKSIATWLSDGTNTRNIQVKLGTLALGRVVQRGNQLAKELDDAALTGARIILKSLDLKVIVSGTSISATFDPGWLVSSRDGVDVPRAEIVIATSLANYGHEPRLRLDPPVGSKTAWMRILSI
jgi:hypothetical protein